MSQKIPDTSADIRNENLEKLREVFPQFVSENTIDFDALQKFFEREGILADTEKYGLNWAGKSNAFRAIRTPATGTLVPQMDESKNWDETENIFIEGDNLEVLKLLQKHYANPGKIKMIYIDPPYNTGKDFVYKDNFTQGVADYYEQTGQTQGGIKMTTNTEKNGRYHSDWLTMMYPRLFLARNLLRDDGVIFVSIDDNEVANLRLMMDEIFGEENVEQMVWQKVGDGDAGAGKMKVTNRFRVEHEYILVGYKNKEKVLFRKTLDLPNFKNEYKNPDNDPRGAYKAGNISQSGDLKDILPNIQNCYLVISPSGKKFIRKWHFPKEEFDLLNEDGRIYWGKNGDAVPSLKIFVGELREVTPVSIIFGKGSTTSGNKEIKEIFNTENPLFDNPKPTSLLKYLFQIGFCSENDIILDFFAGSGTTAHAVMDLNAEDGGNRKWICVQLPEETDEKSEARKAGYETIADISRERIRRAGGQIKNRLLESGAKSSMKVLEQHWNSQKIEITEREEKDLDNIEILESIDLGFKSFVLSSSNYRKWSEITDTDDVEILLEQSKLFIENPLVDNYDEQSVVYEILEKEGFGLNAKVVQETGELKPWIVTENDRKIVITFAEIVTQEQVEKLKLSADDMFVCFDNALDDTGKVNIGRSFNIKTI